MASDTTLSVHIAGVCIDAYQQDCQMHVLSLILCYLLGSNKNTRTTTANTLASTEWPSEGDNHYCHSHRNKQ